MTGGIKSSEENRAQDAACSWKTGEYLDAYGKPTGERFITTERISARFDSNYVNDADGSACVRYIVCSDDDCICIRLFKYGKYPVTNAGSTTKYYIIFFTDTEGKRHMLEGYTLPGGSSRYYSCQLNTMLRVEDGVITLKLPNLFSMTTHDNQTLSLSDVQIRQVSVTADSTSTRYAASDAAEREFS